MVLQTLLIDQFRRRVAAYAATIIALALGFWVIQGITWEGDSVLHVVMETTATLLALIVGILSLVRFHTRKNNNFLFIGAGFFNTALLDGYHTVVSSPFFSNAFPDAPSSLMPWSWLASRVFLSALLWLSWLAWRREKKLGESGKIGEREVYFIVGLLTLESFAFFAIVQLPNVYFPTLPLPRLIEFAPAFIFLLALMGYLHKGHWKHDDFEHWLVLSLIIGIMAEIPFMSSSGRFLDAEFNAAHLLKVASYIAVLFGLVTNIYDLFKRSESQEEALKIALNELKGSQAQLVQSEKMTAIGTMTAGVAHELNNPMMGILNFAQYCAANTDENDKRYPVLTDIEKETRRCIRIVQNLLTFSRMEKEGEENYEQQDCSRVLNQVFNLLAFRIEKERVIVSQEVEEHVPPIWMRVNNIQQVFFNLVTNALDALDESEKDTSEIRVRIRAEGEYVRVEIGDNAAGIDPQYLERVFDPFFTTKTVGKGTGLGLSISYGIVKAHGGEMTCESQVGVGTRFTISLPMKRVKTEAV